MPINIHRGRWIVGAAAVLLVASGCGKSDENASMAGGTAAASGEVAPAAATGASALNADEADDRVEDALRADSGLAAFGLDADDERGRVVLEGTVATEAQKARAAEVAASTAPGVTVDNQVRVNAGAASREASHKAADEADDRVEDAFDADSTLRALDLDVDDEDGRLVLKGSVRTAAQRTQAEDLAKRTASGIRVDNQIKVE